MSATLLDAGVTPLILNEPNEKLAATLTRRFEARNDITIFQDTLGDYLAREGPSSVDASANVLEHIKDDEGCLANGAQAGPGRVVTSSYTCQQGPNSTVRSTAS